MASVQTAMMAGLPYTALRDAIWAHPTLVEGLSPLFSSAPTWPPSWMSKSTRRSWRTAILDRRQEGEWRKSVQLRSLLEEAQSNGVAVGHFNVSDWILLKAVFASAQEFESPGNRRRIRRGARIYGGSSNCGLSEKPARGTKRTHFFNADHTHSLDSAIAAAKAGFDSIVYDLSALPFEENVKQTRQALEALKSINPAILVEGEIGNIGTGSEIHESMADHSKDMTTPEEAKTL